MLEKLTKEHDTQKNVLELALENLENNPGRSQPLPPEDELLVQISCDSKAVCVITKDALKMLLRHVDMEEFGEFVDRYKPVEHHIEYIYQKPLKDCTLKEVIDGIIIMAKMTRWFDTINCKDHGDHYLLTVTHNMGINNSKTYLMSHEAVFQAMGVKTESKISDVSIFMKIFKELQ